MVLLGPAMTYAKFRDQTEEQVKDRAYRVRKNLNQMRVDRGWIAGGAVGSIVFTLSVTNPLLGELVGSSIGLLGTAYYNNMYLAPPKDTTATNE